MKEPKYIITFIAGGDTLYVTNIQTGGAYSATTCREDATKMGQLEARQFAVKYINLDYCPRAIPVKGE